MFFYIQKASSLIRVLVSIRLLPAVGLLFVLCVHFSISIINVFLFVCCRFYSHNSCFVHGGVEKPGEEQPPVMGQAVSCQNIVDVPT